MTRASQTYFLNSNIGKLGSCSRIWHFISYQIMYQSATEKFLLILLVTLIVTEPLLVQGRKGRGRSRGKASLNQRLPEGTKWRDQEAKGYYENPAGAKITKASHFDLEYVLGHKIYFMCMAEGFPRPQITWFKDGAEMYFHDQLMIHVWNNGNKTKSKMEIDPATQMDAGIYECVAENKYNYDRRSFRTDFITVAD